MLQYWTHCFFFFMVRRILRSNVKSMEQKGIFVQIQKQIMSTKLSLLTIIANNLKLSPNTSVLFCQPIKWFNISKKRKGYQI